MSELTDRLRELSRAVSEHCMGEFTMRVPAEPKRDADIVLAIGIELGEERCERIVERLSQTELFGTSTR